MPLTSIPSAFCTYLKCQQHSTAIWAGWSPVWLTELSWKGGSCGADISLSSAPGTAAGEPLRGQPFRIPLPGTSVCLADPAHGLGSRGGDAAEEHCCREAQTGGKNEEEEPCLLPCPCCNLNHMSEHSVPRTAYSVMLHDVEICS